MSTPQQSWQRVTELFDQALERGPQERGEFLKAACAGEANLLGEVESLLAEHEAEADFLESPAVASVADQIAEDNERLSIGQKLGQYRINALLGAGGMGEVYVAQDKLGRNRALKLLTQKFSGDKSGVARFQQEARTLLALNHPHIVTIHDIDQTEGVYYIASELVEGQTLRQRLDQGDIRLEEVLDISIQVATALSAAHEKGIIHRDIKPENLMIRCDGFVKVLDFGIAKLTENDFVAGPEAPTLKLADTAAGTVVGTVPYMSPEQARGLNVDARTDIWSLGVLIYEAVAGHKPFSGDTTADVISSVIAKTLKPPLTRFATDVPEDLERIVSRALRKERETRYQTANDLLSELKELRTKLEVAKASAGVTAVTGISLHAAIPGTRTNVTHAASTYASSAEYIATEIKRHKLALALCFLILVGGIVGTSVYLKSGQPGVAASEIQSLAVLPFKNESGSPDMEYLSDGISEALINRLSQLPQLKVISRNSSFQYKGKDVNPQDVSRALGVEAILQGRVMQHDDSLVVSLELMNVRDKTQVWGERYTAKASDIQALQDDLARTISEKLRLRLSGGKQQLVKRDTTNPSSYQAYLKGRYFWNKRTEADLKKAIEYFNEAIVQDPNYAVAYAGLADCYQVLPSYSTLPPEETYVKARAAANKALEIDETVAEAHAALGVIKFEYEWDFPGAEREYRRAIELSPNYASAHQWYAEFLGNMERHDEAIAEAKRALEIDPLSLIINVVLGGELWNARRYDQAEAQLLKTIEMDRNFGQAHVLLGLNYLGKGMYVEAIKEYEIGRILQGRDPQEMARYAATLKAAYEKAEAKGYWRARLNAALENRKRGGSAFDVVRCYAQLGEKDQAFALLEISYQKREAMFSHLKATPDFDNLRSDPRFHELLRRIGLES